MSHRDLCMDDYYFNRGVTFPESRREVVGIHYFDAGDIFFDGHFPGAPVVPGVLIIKGMLSAIALLMDRDAPGTAVAEFIISRIRFKKVLKPSDLVCMRAATDDSMQGRRIDFKVTVSLDGERTASGEISVITKGGENAGGTDA
jgi:3-hydroxymyristoyl/3-hydroxydecanoyl-(acyl carrier protein) dehydratase